MAERSYPIRFPDQWRQHLRALRKSRQVTQAQLGVLLGVSQARIAEIEANPAAVSVEQLMKILSVLDATMMLQEEIPSPPAQAGTKTDDPPPHGTPLAANLPLESATSPSSARSMVIPRQAEATAPSPPEKATSSTPKRKLMLRSRKGSW